MATKLHDTYGYDYANLKVLLGGWTEWKNQNAQDPAGYPIEGTGATGGTAPEIKVDPGLQVVTNTVTTP